MLTARKHDVYTISHPRKLRLYTGWGGPPSRRVYHEGDNDYQLALQGGVLLAGFSSPLSSVNTLAWNVRPTVTCAAAVDGCRRLTSIFYQCCASPSAARFFLAPKGCNHGILSTTRGSYKSNITYAVAYTRLAVTILGTLYTLVTLSSSIWWYKNCRTSKKLIFINYNNALHLIT